MKTLAYIPSQRGAGPQDRQVPVAKEKTVKVFAGIYASKRFSAESAHTAFAGLKAKK